MYYEIYENGELINTVVGSVEFVKAYCEKNGYTYKVKEHETHEVAPEPTQLDIIEAQVTYTAMMTNTLVGV